MKLRLLILQVILVGHDFGGACISYAMELFPSKVAKAIFIAASMLKTGQSTLDMFSHKVCPIKSDSGIQIVLNISIFV